MNKGAVKKLNCIAINPQWSDENFLSFPLGLATIVSIIQSKKHDVRVFDFDAQRFDDTEKAELLGRVDPHPDIVLLTGMITNYSRIKSLSKIVRKIWPGTYIILGGSLATTAPDALLKNIEADIFVMGEGDKIIVSLLDAITIGKSLRGIPGIKIKDNKLIYATRRYNIPPDITKTQRPAYEDFPMQRYMEFLNKTGRYFEMYTSKGCPFKCCFCYRISGDRVRHRLVEDVVKEILFIKNTYSFNCFSFEDDNFGLNKIWIDQFCNLIGGERIKFRFQANAKTLNEEIIDKLKRAGLDGVSMGIESGSPAILREIGKNIDLEKTVKVIKMLRSRDIKINASFIIGAPGENDESINMTKKFLIENGFKNNFKIIFLTPYPGTPFYDRAIKAGIIKDELNYIENLKPSERLNLNLTGYGNEKLNEWKNYLLC